MRAEREYLTAVSIQKGIILLIDPNGMLRKYRQRGIGTLSRKELYFAIYNGLLIEDWESFPELPYNYSISFEDPEIMGRALATFCMVLDNRKRKQKSK